MFHFNALRCHSETEPASLDIIVTHGKLIVDTFPYCVLHVLFCYFIASRTQPTLGMVTFPNMECYSWGLVVNTDITH